MPELPEVETIKKDLIKGLLGRRIEDVVVYDERVIRGRAASDFKTALMGYTVVDLTRRGKAIIAQLSHPALAGGKQFLVIQVMMTGQLIFSASAQAMPMTRITFRLSNDQYLHYNDQRLFGRLQIVHDPDEIGYLKTIGPEPLSRGFQVVRLAEQLQRRSIPIKTLLLNPRFVAGIGNIYASEILFASRINPKRPAKSVKPEEIKRLHQATIDVLKEAIRLRGTSMRNYRDGKGQKGGFMNRIKVYGREHERCYRCRAPIQRIVQSGRSTFFCKSCQR